MRQSGITTDGSPVYSDAFKLVGTHGLPLEMVLDDFKARGCVVDWPDYVASALKDGHKPGTIKARILSAVGDVHGPVHRNEVEKRLEMLLG